MKEKQPIYKFFEEVEVEDTTLIDHVIYKAKYTALVVAIKVNGIDKHVGGEKYLYNLVLKRNTPPGVIKNVPEHKISKKNKIVDEGNEKSSQAINRAI